MSFPDPCNEGGRGRRRAARGARPPGGCATGRCPAVASRGSALVLVILALLLLSALGAAMIALATADTLAAANQRDARAVLYAAESALEMAADELVRLPDWNAVLAGTVRSSRVDGPPVGGRSLPGGGTLWLEEVPNLANCGQPVSCSAAALAAVTADRPWGADNPHWRLFAFGPIAGGPSSLPVYTIVLVADDPMESDAQPSRDAPPGSPGAGIVLLRAEAFGPGGSRQLIQAACERVVTPTGAVAPRFLTWFTAG